MVHWLSQFFFSCSTVQTRMTAAKKLNHTLKALENNKSPYPWMSNLIPTATYVVPFLISLVFGLSKVQSLFAGV